MISLIFMFILGSWSLDGIALFIFDVIKDFQKSLIVCIASIWFVICFVGLLMSLVFFSICCSIVWSYSPWLTLRLFMGAWMPNLSPSLLKNFAGKSFSYARILSTILFILAFVLFFISLLMLLTTS